MDPRQRKKAEVCNALAPAIDGVLRDANQGRRQGFMLMVFDLGTDPNDGFTAYISNGNAEDMIAALKYQVARLEAGIHGHSEGQG